MDEVTINFPSMFELLNELKLMAETNASLNRPTYIAPDVLQAAAAIYKGLGIFRLVLKSLTGLWSRIIWPPGWHDSGYLPNRSHGRVEARS